MQYNPHDADPILLSDGEYDADILSAEEKTSKAGNVMLKLVVRIFHAGVPFGHILIDEYLVSSVKGHLTKLKKLCKVIDFNFDGGKIAPSDLEGRRIRVFVKTREDDTGKYDSKNVIVSYLSNESPPTNETSAAPADDDIPF